MTTHVVLSCYSLRYSDLLNGYCGGVVDACDWTALGEHMSAIGAREGRIVTCNSHDVRCYVRRYEDLAQAFCTDGDPTHCTWHDLLEHWHTNGEDECAATGLKPSLCLLRCRN